VGVDLEANNLLCSKVESEEYDMLGAKAAAARLPLSGADEAKVSRQGDAPTDGIG
jgi:hypothetical protein